MGAAALWLIRPSLEPQIRLSLSVSSVEQHRDVLVAAGAESGLDAELLAAVMFVESSGRVDARSSKGALGLFQLMPGTAADMARELALPEPTEQQLLGDARLNARLGARYLAQLVRRFGRAGSDATDVEPALVAYNTGPARLERLVNESGDWETWRARAVADSSALLGYARRVLRARDYYREQQLFVSTSDERGGIGVDAAR